MDPVTAAALEAGRRVVIRRIVKWTAVLMPLVLVAWLALSIYASLLLVDTGSEEAYGSDCRSVSASKSPVKVGGLSGEQVANAQMIVAAGRKLEVSERGLLIALMTALQESSLQNIPYGDRDSLGIFQQRDPWGSRAERLDVATATEFFFTGGRGGQPGLLDIPGWTEMDLTVAAQRVQASAFPTAYAKWQGVASSLLDAKGMTGIRCATTIASSSGIVKAAMQWLGTPYSWGGGSIDGPTEGFAQGTGIVGFDCSSLVQNAVYATTGVLLPRTAAEQATAVEEVAIDDAQAGDLLFFLSPGAPPGAYHHVSIYDGAGGMVHAPRTGRDVETVDGVLDNPYWRSQLAFVGRVAGSENGEQGAAA